MLMRLLGTAATRVVCRCDLIATGVKYETADSACPPTTNQVYNSTLMCRLVLPLGPCLEGGRAWMNLLNYRSCRRLRSHLQSYRHKENLRQFASHLSSHF